MKLHISVLLVAVLELASRACADDLILPCTSQADCADVPMATCTLPAGRCDCPKGYVFNGELTSCLAVSSGFGAACEDSIQCAPRLLTGASCSEKSTCECAAGFHYLHGRCWKSKDLGEPCSSSAQCYGNFNHEALSCAAGVCACSEGFYLHAGGTYCRRQGKEPGDDCTFDFDCQCEGGCSCNQEDQTCISSTNFGAVWAPRMSNGKNVPVSKAALPTAAAQQSAKVGETCAGDAECRAADPNAECSTAGTCWCARGFYDKSGVCLRELGEPCELESDCTHITNGTCRALPAGGSICSCNSYSIPGANNQRCNRLRPEIEINCQGQLETCQNFGPLCNCVTLSPSDVKCRCLENSHFEEGPQACWLSKALGEACSVHEDCSVAGGKETVECNDSGVCACAESFHPNNGDCRKDALVFGEECLDDIDCLLPNTACGDGTCICKSGYFPSSIDEGPITCLTGIGGTCTINGDCNRVENAMCNSTICVCKEDPQYPLVANEMRDQCLPVVQTYGGECTDTVQCHAAFGEKSNCTDSSCLCLDNFHFLEQDQACWANTYLHERCYNGRDCFVPSGSDRADCVNGICRCQYQYVEDVDTMDCISGGNKVHHTIGALASLIACILLATLL